METTIFHHISLENDIDYIIEKMETIESWREKMAIDTLEFFEYESPFCIDVEDETYWYEDKDKRDEDFDSLVKILNEKSDNFIY